MPDFFDLLAWAVFALALIAAAVAWTAAWIVTILHVVSALRGESALPREPRRLASWGLLDVLYVMALIQCAPLVGKEVEKILPDYFDVDTYASVANAAVGLTTSLAALVAMFLAALLVMARTDSGPRDLGFDLRQVVGDIWLGFVALVIVGPIVFAIQAALTFWFPSQHPLLESLREHPDRATIIHVAVAALVVAPLSEEFVFRVLLQGWIERMATLRGGFKSLFLGEAPPVLGDHTDALTAPLADASKASAVEIPKKPGGEVQYQPGLLAQWLPIVCSAAVFALLHLGHGPDPIPLFVFALALGYLYQRTGRILPSLTLHFLLNGVSLLMLMIEVYGPRA
jgi:membrane protease YdiL (CAAX protease family)